MQKIFLLFLVTLYSCQTPIYEKKPFQMSKHYKSLFTPCENSSNFADFKIFYNNQLKMSSQIEWIVNTVNEYSIFLIDPLGQELITLQIDDYSINMKTAFSQLNSNIRFDRDGFLLLNNFWIGIHKNEIPCLLNHSLPSSWINKIYYKKVYDQREKLILKNKDRKIFVDIFYDNEKKIEKICSKFRWNIFWFLKRGNLTICQIKRPTVKTTANFNDNITFEINHLQN